MRWDLTLFADYFQLYVQDDDVEVGDLGEAWDEQTVADMLAVVPHAVGVGTARNTKVPVAVVSSPSAPPLDEGAWDHITEASLDCRTGRLVVAGCSDHFPDAFRVAVEPGNYRVRAQAVGLGTVGPDGLAGDDRYQLDIWPAALADPTILKRYPGPRP